MKMKDKIAQYVEQGLSASQIAKITGYNYKSVYSAMHPEMYAKKKNYDEIIERPKGWNKDKSACKTCRYSNRSSDCDETMRNRCNYIFIAGHSRGAKVEDCNRYVKGRRINIKPFAMERGGMNG